MRVYASYGSCVHAKYDKIYSFKITTLPYDLRAITCVSKVTVSQFHTVWRGVCGFLYVDWAPLDLATDTARVSPPAETRIHWGHYRSCTELCHNAHTAKVVLLQANDAWTISTWS